MIRVLLVDDSPTALHYLVHLINSDPDMRVAAAIGDGSGALAAVLSHQPDVVVMDVHMPRVDGVVATREIMESAPTPVVIMSGSSRTNDTVLAARAIDVGAVAVVRKPVGPELPEHVATTAAFLACIRSMAEVRVVRRWAAASRHCAPTVGIEPPVQLRLVAIGASTGGPVVLQTIFSQLPGDFRIPIVAVQHMARGFVEGFVQWLRDQVRRPISVAVHGQALEPGCLYVAPDGGHMEFDSAGTIVIRKDGSDHGHIPSVSRMFHSAASVFGPAAVGVLLTGMGSDGADGLRAMREAGALTIAQDRETAVVYGMPAEAAQLNAAQLYLSPAQIVGTLAHLHDLALEEARRSMPPGEARG